MIEAYDPTGTLEITAAAAAPGLERLAGARVALLANGKEHSESVLERIAERWASRGVTFVHVRKPSHNDPAPAEVIEAIADCDAAITALGA